MRFDRQVDRRWSWFLIAFSLAMIPFSFYSFIVVPDDLDLTGILLFVFIAPLLCWVIYFEHDRLEDRSVEVTPDAVVFSRTRHPGTRIDLRRPASIDIFVSVADDYRQELDGVELCQAGACIDMTRSGHWGEGDVKAFWDFLRRRMDGLERGPRLAEALADGWVPAPDGLVRVSRKPGAATAQGEWERLDHLRRDRGYMALFALIIAVGVPLLAFLPFAADLSSDGILVGLFMSLPFSLAFGILALMWGFEALVRSRRLRRWYPLPLDEARTRLDGHEGFEPEAAGEGSGDRVWYRAPALRARVLLERVAADEERTAVEVAPPDGEADVTRVLRMLDGAFGERQK